MSCTDFLQPLDIKVNKLFKDLLKAEFNEWYLAEIFKALESGTVITDVKIDLRSSALKPIHAKWMVFAVNQLSDHKDIIKTAFEAAGITCKAGL